MKYNLNNIQDENKDKIINYGKVGGACEAHLFRCARMQNNGWLSEKSENKKPSIVLRIMLIIYKIILHIAAIFTIWQRAGAP